MRVDWALLAVCVRMVIFGPSEEDSQTSDVCSGGTASERSQLWFGVLPKPGSSTRIVLRAAGLQSLSRYFLSIQFCFTLSENGNDGIWR
jgi:hypothetical protein